jgi:hypothetical protein
MVFLGIAIALFSRSALLDKVQIPSSTINKISKVRTSEPEFVDTTPSFPSGTQTNVVSAIDPPVASSSIPQGPEKTAVGDDPEKIALLISAMSEAELSKKLAQLSQQDLTSNTGRLLVRRWVELDPAAAINWVTQLADAGTRREMIDLVAVAWSEKNMPDALAWVESLPPDSTKDQALTDLGYEVARAYPVGALNIALQLPDSANAEGLLLHALAQWASENPDSAKQWALALPPGQLREQSFTTLATALANQDGAGAAQFAMDNLSAGPDLDRAVIAIVQRWSQANLVDAATWVQSFPDSPIRNQAVQSLVMVDAP